MASSTADVESSIAPLLVALARAPDVDPSACQPVGAGDRIGDYEVLGDLGRGGMGTVHRARDVRLGREVALKVIQAGSSTTARRFLREARALARIQHECVVRIHDVGMRGNEPFLALELFQGATLRDRLQRGALAAHEAIAIARGLLSALAAAHDAGVVHRDVKPENVFLTSSGETKLLDFGLAKTIERDEADETETLTRTGVVLGTCGYMAPEQVRGEAVDGRADLFAVGAVLYEMLSGRRSFAGRSSIETLNAVLTTEPAALDVEHGVEPALAAFVERCLAKARDERFESASAAVDALERAARGVGPARPAPRRPPKVRFARSGSVHIAYQTFGEGPDLVVVPGFVSSSDTLWELPECRRFLAALATGRRVTLFDKRGTGRSDRVAPDDTGMHDRVDDLRAVLDAIGVERAAILGVSEGAAIGLALAATHPERVRSLVAHAGTPTYDYTESIAELLRIARTAWGSGASLDLFGPSVATDSRIREWWGQWELSAASPGAVVAHIDAMVAIDIRGAVRGIRVPCLITHRAGDRAVPAFTSRWVAARVPACRLVELEGDDHLPFFGDWQRFVREVHEFSAANHDSIPRNVDLPASLSTVAGCADARTQSFDSVAEAVRAGFGAARDGARAAVHAAPPRYAIPTSAAAAARAAPGELLFTSVARGLVYGRHCDVADAGVHDLGETLGRSRLYRAIPHDDVASSPGAL